MNILHSAHNILTPIRREGYPFIALFFVISVFLGFWWQFLFWLGLALTLWCIYFFRDPPRLVPLRDNIVVSPADGKVSFAGLFVPPHGLGLPEEEMLRISVFMDVFSCHVNRLPLNASVKAITYRKGRFFNAEWDKASTENEANSVLLETAHGTVGLVQIAGLVARRIICWVNHGEELSVGQRFGLIRFGSRVDIYLPLTAELCVGVGQSMIAGETVLAQFSPEKNPEPKKRGAKGAKPAAGHNIEFRLD